MLGWELWTTVPLARLGEHLLCCSGPVTPQLEHCGNPLPGHGPEGSIKRAHPEQATLEGKTGSVGLISLDTGTLKDQEDCGIASKHINVFCKQKVVEKRERNGVAMH